MKNSFFSELKTTIKIFPKDFVLKAFASILVRGVLLIIPVLFSYSINYISNNNFKMAIVLMVISIFVTAIYRFAECFNQYSFYLLYNKIFSYYCGLGLSKTNNNSLFSLSRFTLGQYTNTVITDVDVISNFLASTVIRVAQGIEFLVIFIYFYFLDPYLFLAALILSIVMLFITIKSGNKIQKLNEIRKVKLDKMTSSIHEFFLGIKEIKSFNIFNNIFPIAKEDTNSYLKINADYTNKFTYNNQAFVYVFELFRLLSMIYGIFLMAQGKMELGILLIIYNYYQKIVDNFSNILTINVDYRNFSVSLTRLYKLVEFSHDKQNKKDLNIEQIQGNINFKNILYGFKNSPILNNLSFEIKANSLTAIIGNDEAGQNGIFDLLLKLNKQHEGEIRIDNIDINDIGDSDYFKLLSASRRQAYFFNVSIADNLKMIEPDEEKTIQLCKKVGVHDNIMKLKNGYETIMSDNAPITAATKQLLAIVRMMLKKSKVLLFDDTINNLDDNSKNKMLEMITSLKKDHTVIVICHDKEIIAIADNVIEI